MSKSLMFSTSANSVALESSTVSSSTFNNGDSEIQHCHDDDDFAAFESAECSLSLPPHSSVGTMSSNEKLKEQFTIAFPGKVLEEKTIPKLEQVNYRDVLLGGYSSRSCKLWERLRSVEKMPESQFQWEQSQSYQQLLRSLNVDTRNILCNPSVSLSVSGLGLLELPRGPASINRNKNTRKEATKESVLGSDDEDLYTNFRTPNPKSDDYYFNEVDEFHAAKDKILLGEDDTTGLEEDGLDQEEVMGLELSEDDDEDSELDDYYTVKKDQMISDNEDGDLPDVKAWGKRKSMYYSADYVDEDYGGVQAEEEELIAAEEREVLTIQRRLAEEIDEEELELEWFLPQKNEEGKDEKVVEEKITRDLSKLSKREKLELLKQESPELLDLVEEFKLQMNELNDKIQPIVQLIKSGVIPPGPASEFLITKQNLILNYCTNISFYMVLKAQRVSVRNHPVMKRLLAYRNLLKKLEPVDKKLSPEINEILEKLNKGEHIEPKLSSNLKKPPKQKLRILQQKEDSVEPKVVENEEQDKRKKVRLVETADEKEVLSLYEMMKGGKKTTQSNEEISIEDEAIDEDEGEEGEKRGISYEIAKNKGLTPHRKKEQRNPRVRLKMKYKKAKTRRKGQVREPRKELSRYGGELSGIRAGVVHSIKLK